ncbi:MAG TPA: cupin domain-containing protein [Saprospiraceae bacterium]|nr:cupin domain-containing protein [Saprospiraceae bacterium]MBK8888078.1 cupin domain-containing protein [Saprospiraceae bacterium]HRG41279.1 cupin domain-containing protein [Saprospiraceae bacterium]
MVVKDQILDITPLGMIFKVINGKNDTEGRSLDLEWQLLPKCNMADPLFHIHPEAIETYHILEGEMEFFIKDRWITAKTGDKLKVDKGVKHAFRNPTDSIVKVFNTHEPALNMEEYFEDVSKVVAIVKNKNTNTVNLKNLKTLLFFGALMRNYRKEIIAVDPPDFLVRILGTISKLIGIDYQKR